MAPLDELTARFNICKHGDDSPLPLVNVLDKSTTGGDAFEHCQISPKLGHKPFSLTNPRPGIGHPARSIGNHLVLGDGAIDQSLDLFE